MYVVARKFFSKMFSVRLVAAVDGAVFYIAASLPLRKLDARQSLTVALSAISVAALLISANWSVNWFACAHRIG